MAKYSNSNHPLNRFLLNLMNVPYSFGYLLYFHFNKHFWAVQNLWPRHNQMSWPLVKLGEIHVCVCVCVCVCGGGTHINACKRYTLVCTVNNCSHTNVCNILMRCWGALTSINQFPFLTCFSKCNFWWIREELWEKMYLSLEWKAEVWIAHACIRFIQKLSHDQKCHMCPSSWQEQVLFLSNVRRGSSYSRTYTMT
jgi:hypothetical protein